MFYHRQPQQCQIDAILSVEGVTLEQVFMDPAFSVAAKSGSTQLYEYLFRQDVFEELMNWIFTSVYDDHPKYCRIGRLALLVPATTSSQMQNTIRTMPGFLDRIRNFPESDYARDPKVAGNFAYVIEIIVRQTNGEFLQDVPMVIPYLIKNLDIADLRDLFVLLVNDFSPQIHADSDLMLEVATEAKGRAAYHVASTIISIIRMKKKESQDFWTPEVLAMLIDSASSPTCQAPDQVLFAVNTIMTHFGSEKLAQVVETKASLFDLDQISSPVLRAAVISVFKNPTDQDILNTLVSSNNTFLSYHVVASVKPDRLIELDIAHSLRQKIIESHETNKTNPFIYKLAEIINNSGIDHAENESWSSFTSDALPKRLSNLSVPEPHSP